MTSWDRHLLYPLEDLRLSRVYAVCFRLGSGSNSSLPDFSEIHHIVTAFVLVTDSVLAVVGFVCSVAVTFPIVGLKRSISDPEAQKEPYQ